MSKKGEKPVLWGNAQNDSVQLHEADDYAWDNFTPGYVPGYDEVVKANEVANNRSLSQTAREKLYTQLRAQPRALPVEFHWVRVAGIDGGRSYNASVDLATWRRQGYRPATMQVLEEHGFKMPPTAHEEADGTIRREDVALWYVDAERARRNKIEQARFNADFHAVRNVETGNSEVPFFEVAGEEAHRGKTLTELKDT